MRSLIDLAKVEHLICSICVCWSILSHRWQLADIQIAGSEQYGRSHTPETARASILVHCPEILTFLGIGLEGADLDSLGGDAHIAPDALFVGCCSFA